MAKKPKIIITWDKVHGLPQAKFKNVSTEQILDAGIFLKGTTYKQRHQRKSVKRTHKQQNKLMRFIRRFIAMTKSTRSEHRTVHEREVAIPFPLR